MEAGTELASWKPRGGPSLRPELTSAGSGGATCLLERNTLDCFVCFGPGRASGLFAVERPVTGPLGTTPLIGRGPLGGLPGSNKRGPGAVCAALTGCLPPPLAPRSLPPPPPSWFLGLQVRSPAAQPWRRHHQRAVHPSADPTGLLSLGWQPQLRRQLLRKLREGAWLPQPSAQGLCPCVFFLGGRVRVERPLFLLPLSQEVGTSGATQEVSSRNRVLRAGLPSRRVVLGPELHQQGKVEAGPRPAGAAQGRCC